MFVGCFYLINIIMACDGDTVTQEGRTTRKSIVHESKECLILPVIAAVTSRGRNAITSVGEGVKLLYEIQDGGVGQMESENGSVAWRRVKHVPPSLVVFVDFQEVQHPTMRPLFDGTGGDGRVDALGSDDGFHGVEVPNNHVARIAPQEAMRGGSLVCHFGDNRGFPSILTGGARLKAKVVGMGREVEGGPVKMGTREFCLEFDPALGTQADVIHPTWCLRGNGAQELFERAEMILGGSGDQSEMLGHVSIA